jgi:hypothetical protein
MLALGHDSLCRFGPESPGLTGIHAKPPQGRDMSWMWVGPRQLFVVETGRSSPNVAKQTAQAAPEPASARRLVESRRSARGGSAPVRSPLRRAVPLRKAHIYWVFYSLPGPQPPV